MTDATITQQPSLSPSAKIMMYDLVVSSKGAPSSLSPSSDPRAHPLPSQPSTRPHNSERQLHVSHLRREISSSPTTSSCQSYQNHTNTSGMRSPHIAPGAKDAKVALPSRPPCIPLESRPNIPPTVLHLPDTSHDTQGTDGQTRHSTHTRTRRLRPGRGNSACRPTIKSAETHLH